VEVVRKTIGQMVDSIAREQPDLDAIVHTEIGSRYTYALLAKKVDQVARGFIRAGIRPGHKLAIWAPNIPEWIISMVALAKIGVLMVPIDPGAEKETLSFILRQSECQGIIMPDQAQGKPYLELLRSVRSGLPNLSRVFLIAEKHYPGVIRWSELEAGGEQANQELFQGIKGRVKPEDAVAIMYTSGTTGNPKGVELDHLGLINKSMYSTARQGIGRKDRLALFFPLFHMFGNTCIALAGLLRGAALIMPCLSFEPSRILPAIQDEKCTAIYGSPSMLISLLEHPHFKKSQWKTVRKGIIGGAPCPMDLMKKLVEDIGVSDITVGYGITETCSWITMTSTGDPIELRVATIGRPLECNEVKIVDPATGESLPPKKQGEICSKGFLMKGYYKMPGATAAAIDRGGWFHTGDLGEMDEQGYVRITGRLKDVILRNGVEIFPVELEETLYKIPDVVEAQVFGIPHTEKGQEVVAWVRVREGSSLIADDIEAYMRENVEAQRMPSYFKIVSSFPMTRSGKVQKFKLSQMAQLEIESLRQGT